MNLFDVISDEHYIDAAYSQLVNDHEDVNDGRSSRREPPHPIRSHLKSTFHRFRIGQHRYLFPPAQFVLGPDQNMQAVGAKDSYQNGIDRSRYETSVEECLWHRHYPSTKAAFQ